MSARLLPFPHNLTPGQVRCIEAVKRHGTFAAAAVSLRIAEGTLAKTLKKARMRAEVGNTADLVRRYVAAKGPAA